MKKLQNKHLSFCCMYGILDSEERPEGHPQEIMKRLGITYQHATPQSISDQWWFWNCENIPKELPPYLEFKDLDPMKMIGWGLSKKDSERIRDAKPLKEWTLDVSKNTITETKEDTIERISNSVIRGLERNKYYKLNWTGITPDYLHELIEKVTLVDDVYISSVFPNHVEFST